MLGVRVQDGQAEGTARGRLTKSPQAVALLPHLVDLVAFWFRLKRPKLHEASRDSGVQEE